MEDKKNNNSNLNGTKVSNGSGDFRELNKEIFQIKKTNIIIIILQVMKKQYLKIQMKIMNIQQLIQDREQYIEMVIIKIMTHTFVNQL